MTGAHEHIPQQAPPVLRIAILGSTGSIGTQTLETVDHLNILHENNQHPTRYEIVGLCARANSTLLQQQSDAHPNATLALICPDAKLQTDCTLIQCEDAATKLIEQTKPDLVVGAIVGIAGLQSTLRAAQLGIDIALANKESLVAGGHLVTQAARESGARILPIDSEHAGLWQTILAITSPTYSPPSSTPLDTIRRVTLTASGGPFRSATLDEIQNASIEQALNHPTWSMGNKVSIDSATLINKALELIEAHWLFGLSADQLDAVIHPQSTVHAFLETTDGSTLAHLGPTDMRCPIQHALTHPHRAPLQAQPLDLTTLSSLDFEPIDPTRFPAIELAKRVIRASSVNSSQNNSSTGAVLNAANEAAVEAFLNHKLSFGNITTIVQDTLDQFPNRDADTFESIIDIHHQAKSLASKLISAAPSPTR